MKEENIRKLCNKIRKTILNARLSNIYYRSSFIKNLIRKSNTNIEILADRIYDILEKELKELSK